MKTYFSYPATKIAQDNPHNGIHQVIINTKPHLENLGWQETRKLDTADLVVSHAGASKGNCDVAINHGLHPTGEHPLGDTHIWHVINYEVAKDIISAYETIVPSNWIAEIIERNFLFYPHVVNWSVNSHEWQLGTNGGYILWNKGRQDITCDPYTVNKLAELLPNQQFITTFGKPSHNVKVIGRTNREEMKTLIQNANIYLSTTRETGDIGSREALASGVPVIAFNHGAITDFLKHGVNGYLVQPNDLHGLVYAVEYVNKNRDRLAHNARKLAQDYNWLEPSQQIADVFNLAYEKKIKPKSVSVIIPNYNYSQYLPEAIESVLSQETNFDVETIVIDDKSTDNSVEIINQYPVKLIQNKQNSKVAYTRNKAIQSAKGDYIVCLDADDKIEPSFLQTLYDELEKSRHVGIAYTRLQFLNGGLSDWLSSDVDYEKFTQGFNQIPTCNMFRKEDFIKVGGYRDYMIPQEDADLWLRLLTFTGRKAVRINKPLFSYRFGHASLSRNAQDKFMARGQAKLPKWTQELRPLQAPKQGKYTNTANRVFYYDKPVISIFIKHDSKILSPDEIYDLYWALDEKSKALQKTLDSIYGQDFNKWSLNNPNGYYQLYLNIGDTLDYNSLSKLLNTEPLKHGETKTGKLIMGCCGKQLIMKTNQTLSESNSQNVVYNGNERGFITIASPTSKQVRYRVRNGSITLMLADDITWFAKNKPNLFSILPEVPTIEVVEVTEKLTSEPVILPDDDTAQFETVQLESIEDTPEGYNVSQLVELLNSTRYQVEKFIGQNNIEPVAIDGNSKLYNVADFNEFDNS